MSQNRENYDLGRDPNDVDIFKKKTNEEMYKGFIDQWIFQQGALFLKGENSSLEWKKSIAIHFYRMGFELCAKIKDKEIAELISVSNANIDLATKYLHEIAERDVEIEKLKKDYGDLK